MHGMGRGRLSLRAVFSFFIGAPGRELPLGNQTRDKHMLPKICNGEKINNENRSLYSVSGCCYLLRTPRALGAVCSERWGLYPLSLSSKLNDILRFKQ